MAASLVQKTLHEEDAISSSSPYDEAVAIVPNYVIVRGVCRLISSFRYQTAIDRIDGVVAISGPCRYKASSWRKTGLLANFIRQRRAGGIVQQAKARTVNLNPTRTFRRPDGLVGRRELKPVGDDDLWWAGLDRQVQNTRRWVRILAALCQANN